MNRHTLAEKSAFHRSKALYSSISGESSESSSSSEGEDATGMSRFQKRIFKDSTSDLRSLGAMAVGDTSNSQLKYFELDPEDMDITNPAYVDLLKIQFFTLGFASGAAIQMFIVSVILMFVSYSQHSGPLLELSHEYYPVFRCIFFIAFFFSLYGGNIFIWRRFKIEYRAVLGVSSAHKYQSVLRGAASVAYIVFTCFMLYVLTITGGLEALNANASELKHLWPALSFLLPLALFFCPYDSLTRPFFGSMRRGYQQRMGMVRDIVAVMLSPLTKPTFLRTFIADIMCSMPKIFTDLQYTMCIYLTGTFWDKKDEWLLDKSIHSYDTCGAGSPLYTFVLTMLSFGPYYIRLMQALRGWVDSGESRHLFNAWKYTLSMSVTGLALLHKHYPTRSFLETAWFVVSTVTTLYCFYWDVVMDWGLGNRVAPYWLLREKLYFQPMTYYTAIILDLVMRLGWAILISPTQTYLQQHLVLLLGCVELMRRFMWAVFRVEWEWIKIQRQHAESIVSSRLKDVPSSEHAVSQEEVVAALSFE